MLQVLTFAYSYMHCSGEKGYWEKYRSSSPISWCGESTHMHWRHIYLRQYMLQVLTFAYINSNGERGYWESTSVVAQYLGVVSPPTCTGDIHQAVYYATSINICLYQ